MFLDVSQALDISFLGWFTYNNVAVEVQLDPIVAAGQRWLVGAGEIDDPREVSTVDPESCGSMTIEFLSCSTALVSYHLFKTDILSSFPIARPVAGSG